MKRRFLSCLCLLSTVFLLSACGSTGKQQEKIAVFDLKKTVSSHPRHKELARGEQVLQQLVRERKNQEKLAQAQLASIEKLRALQQLSKESFLAADLNTRMVEAQARENGRLQKQLTKWQQEADELIAQRREQVHGEYQLKLFNLRLKLDSVRMRPQERQALEEEQQRLRAEENHKLGQLEAEKNAYFADKVGPYMAQARERLAQRLREEQVANEAKLTEHLAKQEQSLKDAPEALTKALAIMDREITKQQTKNDQLQKQLTEDAEAIVVRMAHEQGYTIVFNQFQVNLQAADLTTAVVKELQEKYSK